jgi:outer membrane protein TolC
MPARLNDNLPAKRTVTSPSRRPDVRQTERRLAAATAQIGGATADLFPSIHLTGSYGGAATEPSQPTTNLGLVGPWTFNQLDVSQSGGAARPRTASQSLAGRCSRGIRFGCTHSPQGDRTGAS